MPPTPLSDEEIEALARKRAGAKMGWYIHATIYVAVNAYWLIASNMGFAHRSYSLAPALGWGVGLALHGLSVFVLGSGSAFRERMIEKERERIRRQQERP